MKYILATIFILIFVSSCTTAIPTNNESLESLIEDGVLAYFNIEEAEAWLPDFELIQIARGSANIDWSIPVNIEFPQLYHVRFDAEFTAGSGWGIGPLTNQYAHFSGIGSIRAGHHLQEGDFIAELTFETPESVVIARHALELERQQFETTFERNHQARLIEIANLEMDVEFADEGEWEIAALRLQIAQLTYAQFISASENTRSQFETRLENINAPTATQRLYSPVTGVVVTTTQHFGQGMFRNVPHVGGAAGGVVPGRRVLAIADEMQMQMVASSGAHLLRYGEVLRATRMGSDAHFYVTVSTDPFTANIRREGSHRILLEPLPGELERFAYQEAGITDILEATRWLAAATLRVHPSSPLYTDSIVVDRRAVLDENHRNFVMLYENGEIGKRYVIVGNSFGGNVQILAGLEEGQQILLHGSDARLWVDGPG